jgi:hypothetical protein
MTIHLSPALPPGSSDLPGDSGGPPSNVPLFGLAPGGVYQAPAVAGGAGELLPHPFTLTPSDNSAPDRAVSFLLHFPSRRRDWALPSALSSGARTFLSPARKQGSGHLSCSDTWFTSVAFFCLISRIVAPVDDPGAVGAGHELIPPNQFVEFLGRDSQVACLANALDDRADGNASLSFS